MKTHAEDVNITNSGASGGGIEREGVPDSGVFQVEALLNANVNRV